MKHLPFFIAWRYITAQGHEKNISTMIKVCFIGICVGTFALALVAAVMNGFEKATHEKMQSIHPQLMIRAGGNQLDGKAFAQLFEQEFPEIETFSPSSESQVMLQSPETNQVEHVMAIKGFDPAREDQVTNLGMKLIGEMRGKQVKDTVHDNHILVGVKIARRLDLKVGDTITVLFTPQEQQGRKIVLDSTQAIVGGIFETGIEEYDLNAIFSSLTFFHSLFHDSGITQLDIKLRSDAHEDAVVEKLRKRLPNLDVYSWKDLYPALVSALKLEKYVMFFILALITLVASMNIISLLFMQITQKRSDIAILQTLGASQKLIRSIFLWMGMIISLCATTVGLTLSCIVSYILEHYPFITLPDAYYVTQLPSRMEYSLLFFVFALAMIISFISTWIPTRRIKGIKIADVLRFEN